jgi:hypothetical protein
VNLFPSAVKKIVLVLVWSVIRRKICITAKSGTEAEAFSSTSHKKLHLGPAFQFCNPQKVQLGPIFQFNNPKKMALCPCL